jgi:hypothetical protein
MVMSLGVTPHALSVVEVDFANVDATRSTIKAEWKVTEGYSLTYLGFISRAVVDALREFPHLNATVDGDNLVVHTWPTTASSYRWCAMPRPSGCGRWHTRSTTSLLGPRTAS